MKINIVSRKLLKPYTPTPQNLKNYKISFKDELVTPKNVGIMFFYQSRPKLFGQLEESLSKILSQFYPLAGRYIKKNHVVDCSDQGAEFIEAVVTDNVQLTDILNSGRLDELIARQGDLADGVNDPLLSIKITEFVEGDGVVLSVSVSHRIFDGSSIGTFIAAWANANLNQMGKCTIFPSYESVLLYAGKNIDYHTNVEPSQTTLDSLVVKRVLFKKDTITTLRSKLRAKDAAHNTVSRVCIVSTFIATALIRLDRKKHQCSRPCLMVQSVNMRARTIPPLPKHSCGNLALHATTDYIQAASDLRVQEIAHTLTDSVRKTISVCEDLCNEIIIERDMRYISQSKSLEVNSIRFTDWSKFEFYETNFGWGKPILVGVAPMPAERLTVLMDSNDGDGIEAWVHLDKNDVPCFEEDEGIKLFTG